MAKRARGLDRVRQMLSGNHYTQTRKTFSIGESFDKQSKNIKNTSKEKALQKVGDVWEEIDRNGEVIAVWEQKDGYEVKHPAGWTPESGRRRDAIMDTIYGYPNCYSDCKTKVKNRLDEKFRRLSGMCADCHFRMEEKKKISGEYDEYIKEKMYKNALDWFKDADKEIQLFAEEMRKGYKMEKEDGSFLTWIDQQDPDEILQEYEEAKQQTLENLKPDNYNDEERNDG